MSLSVGYLPPLAGLTVSQIEIYIFLHLIAGMGLALQVVNLCSFWVSSNWGMIPFLEPLEQFLKNWLDLYI
jgi:hypothetical protein